MRSLRVAGDPAPRFLVRRNELLDVSAVLDGASSVEAAIVAGDLDAVGEDAHGRVAGADHHALADVGRWHRVAVGVEADAGLLADDGWNDGVGVEGTSRQGSQTGTLDEQSLVGAFPSGGVDTVVGHLIAPCRRLGADVVERAEGAAVEERVSDVLDGALDAAFGLGIAGRRGGRLEQIVSREDQKGGVELHRGAHVVQDDRFEVVVEELLRDTAEVGEGARVHGAESFDALVEGEVEEQGARPRQHHREAAHLALRVANAHPAERAPIHLGLLAGHDLDAQVGLPAHADHERWRQ